jgi:hypothetical protein
MKMHRMIGKLAVLAVFGSAAAMATNIVYSNTTTDTLDTVFFSVGPYSELGDQIHLGGTDRLATSAVVQFFNNGATSTFDATLHLYNLGSPVGSQIGSFTTSGITGTGGAVFNVTFLALNVAVPDDLIFTVSVSNIAGAADLGVDMFEPPTIGTSDNTFMIANQKGFSKLTTPNENVFFELDATTLPVPEPSVVVMVAFGIIFLLSGWNRFRKA